MEKFINKEFGIPPPISSMPCKEAEVRPSIKAIFTENII